MATDVVAEIKEVGLGETVVTPPAKSKVEPTTFCYQQKYSCVPFSKVRWSRQVIVEKCDVVRDLQGNMSRVLVVKTNSSTASLGGLHEFEFREMRQ